MADQTQQVAVAQIEKPISLVPVGLKEAALDSPSFRATAVHFCEQIDIIEKWLDSFTKSIVKVSHEVVTIEALVAGILVSSAPPLQLSEAALDHDYTLLALKRYREIVRDYWGTTILGMKRMESSIVDPIRAFSQGDLRSFKETRRNLDQSQKQFDSLQSRYSSQARTKEPSSLREDAFQLHEARKAYLKASMDFSVVAPQVRMSLDKLMVKIASDQWREIRSSRDGMNGPIAKWGQEIERVRGWSHEMEGGEKAFRREIQATRRQIEEAAEVAARPSRELEDYSAVAASTFLSKGPSSTNVQTSVKPGYSKAEKQGWLNVRTTSGKPARSVWLRRWFYVKNGIFGWLVQGSRSGGVEESERIGVLLCSLRPAIADERRFCFEVMTKDTTLTLQADSQDEVVDWIRAFEVAKQKALEDPASTDSPGLPGSNAQDAAFAINPPSAPEFAASAIDFGPQQRADDTSKSNLDRSITLPIPEGDAGSRSSVDVSSNRRSTGLDADGERRDHPSRIKQKLDLHRKSIGASSNPAAGLVPSSPGFPSAGIASLISASHNVLPVGPGLNHQSSAQDTSAMRGAFIMNTPDLPASTLAPSTLVNPPAPTNLSTAAVAVNGDRGIGMGRIDATGGMPSGLMANLWGTSNWGYMNRLERGEVSSTSERVLKNSNPPSPQVKASDLPKNRSNVPDLSLPGQQKVVAHDAEAGNGLLSKPEFPNYYPVQLKTQDAQFRLLFPNVRREEKVLLVFRATWNPNNQQDFPGRVYVTAKQMYFYSNHYGLVLTTSLEHGSISELTAAPGRDCDFIFLHLKESSSRSQSTRVTIKIFLEPFKLLQRRLRFLVRNFSSEQPLDLESLIKYLIRLESDDLGGSPSTESWDELSMNTPVDEGSSGLRFSSQKPSRDLHTAIRVENGLYGNEIGYEQKDVTKFKLPRQPVVYVPPGMMRVALEKVFEISPKAMFHLMFGDKSAVWQLLYCQRRAQRVKQTSWTQPDQGHMRREFEYEVEYANALGLTCHTTVVDYQMINVLNDHLCYVVTDRKTPFHLPWHDSFTLLSKVVITHVAKSKCKLAIYTSVDWSRPPILVKSFIDRRAIADLDQDALDLTDVITDQVRKLGSRSRTRKSVQIFGQVGIQTQTLEFTSHDETLIPRAQGSIRRYNILGLFMESLATFCESIVTMLMQWSLTILKWAWKTSSANSLILMILALSVAANIFSSSRTTSQWWSDRKAGQFMARLGVGPNLVMSKAVYLQDLDLAAAPGVKMRRTPESKCLETFYTTISLTDLDAPYRSSSPSLSMSSSQGMNPRLSRTRQALGLYRHDLLVAMRVVNSIEREIVQAEWEHWVLNENSKCNQLNNILDQNRTETSKKPAKTKNSNNQQIFRNHNYDYEEVQTWYRNYCESCQREKDILLRYDIDLSS